MHESMNTDILLIKDKEQNTLVWNIHKHSIDEKKNNKPSIVKKKKGKITNT